MRILLACLPPQEQEITRLLPADAIIVVAHTATELLEHLYASAPDIIVADADFPVLIEVLQQIHVTLPAPVVVLAHDAQLVAPSAGTDVVAYFIYPVAPATLQACIEVALRQFQALQTACRASDDLRVAFAQRKVIDRAKGVIMRQYQLGEADAYAWLRDESRRQRTPMVVLAAQLLETPAVPATMPATVMGSATPRQRMPGNARTTCVED